EVASETGYPVEESALRQFYFVTVVDHMDTPNFRSHYLSVISQIKAYTTEEQLLMAFSILDEMPKKYDFEFSIKFDLYNQEDINELYKFVEFVEYDHERLIVDTWKNLKVNNPITLNIEQYCNQNSQVIILELEKQAATSYISEMIADFLRTNDKENLLQWFYKKSEILRSLILLGIL
ncbi:MAG: hypothetical protein MIO93_10975, partial [ANME-2 cluster archaeon]|nr:hypothetical protein [ANME-2 cluster archaeon]